MKLMKRKVSQLLMVVFALMVTLGTIHFLHQMNENPGDKAKIFDLF